MANKVCRSCHKPATPASFITRAGVVAPSCRECRRFYMNNETVALQVKARSRVRMVCPDCGELRVPEIACNVCGFVI